MSRTAASIFPTPPAPQLPDFKTLLIQGDYPASSPFHLCISHMSNVDPQQPRPRPLFVTAKAKSDILTALVELNDEWLVTNAGLGTTASLLSELRIYYPATPDHWNFLFSLFQTGVPHDLETLSPNSNVHLDPPVSLVVLHEPSAFFLDRDDPGSFTMSSYMQLITSALACLPSLDLSIGSPHLAVFDSRLQGLSMPILLPGTEEGNEHSHSRPERVILAVQKYFEWVGTVETMFPSPSSVSLEKRNTHRMCLSPSQYSRSVPITWEWCQIQGDKRRAVFQWS